MVNKFTTQPTNKEVINKINDVIDAMGSTQGANIDLSNLSATGESKFQAPLVSGTNIKTINNTSILGSGDIDTKEIFVATYGTTTYQEISDAITAGKTVICKNSNGNIYTLTYSGNSINKYIFSYSGSNGIKGWIYYCEVDNANTWVDDYSVLVDASLSGLSPQGQAKFDAKADTDLSNLSATGQGIIDAKVNNNDYYYKSGDTVTNLVYWGGGLLTGGGKQIVFSIPLPKSLKNITTITCTALLTGFRKTAGGYMPSSGGNGWNAKANGTVGISKLSDNLLEVSVTYASYGGTNNTPVGVYADISLSFT